MVNWKWTWANFVASLLFNRLRFLLVLVMTQVHGWITLHLAMQPPTCWYLDFYFGSLIVAATLSLLRFSAPHYGVLVPSQPAAVHVLQEEQVVPLLQNPPQRFTRKVFIHKQIPSDILAKGHLIQDYLLRVFPQTLPSRFPSRSELARKGLISVALLLILFTLSTFHCTVELKLRLHNLNFYGCIWICLQILPSK